MFSITGVMSRVNSFLNNLESTRASINRLIQKTPPILLGDIKLQLVSEVSENYSNDVPMIPIDDGSQLTDNVSQNPLTLSFKVQIVGDDHKDIFEKIINMRDKREFVDLYMVKLYKNMAITSIEHPIVSIYYTEFTISLVQIKIAHISMIPAPSIKAKPTVRKKTKIKTGTKAKNIKENGKKGWEGELKSEQIPLPSKVARDIAKKFSSNGRGNKSGGGAF